MSLFKQIQGRTCWIATVYLVCTLAFSCEKKRTVVIVDLDASQSDVSADGEAGRDTVNTIYDAEITCGDEFRAPPSQSPCNADTQFCLRGAKTQEQLDACFESEAMESACRACLRDDLLSCATYAGCADENGATSCCLRQNCQAGDGPCFTSAQAEGGVCHAQVQAFNTCAARSGCSYSGVCFMPD